MAKTFYTHFIGIGGSGLSAIARVLLESGQAVSGSDRQDSALLQSLRAAGARVYVGHRAENITGVSLVIRSSAVGDDNSEVQAARTAGIPVLKRADYLGTLMEGRKPIAIAGTHGKTTTTAMIAWLLYVLEQDPSFIVGGTIHGLGTNARAGQGQAFVIEADEYDGMFLGLRPWLAIVTNLEHDHPDCYPSAEDYVGAFQAFVSKIIPDGILLACADDPGSKQLLIPEAASVIRRLSYGLSEGASYQAADLKVNETGGFRFLASLPGTIDGNVKNSIEVSLQVPGRHNVLNALAALAAADQMGLPLQEAARALGSFTGSGRRFEVVGEAAGVTVVDDYAHHPSEIRATLAAARNRYPGRKLWVVWQPHTYSRTRQLLSAFANAFRDADEVIVTEIYAAREAPPADGFSGRQVADHIQHHSVQFSAPLSQTAAFLLEKLGKGDVLMVLSAGDADQISAKVAEGLSHRRSENA
jgi:UDP-N-acetylmuramate--alanine ligase